MDREKLDEAAVEAVARALYEENAVRMRGIAAEDVYPWANVMQDRGFIRSSWFKAAEAAILAYLQHTRAAAPSGWTCAARAQGNTDPPADCDWPVCGCDPYAGKVIAALQESGALPATAPSGWKCVPVEPTREMGLAGSAAYDALGIDFGGISPLTAGDIYRAMLSASPSPSISLPERGDTDD